MPRTLATNRMLVRDFGTSLQFNNSGTDAVNIATTFGLPISQQTNFTINIWVYTAQLASSHYFFSEGRLATATPVFGFHNDSTGKINLFSRNDVASGGDQVGSIEILKDGVWQMITFTSVSGAIKVYANGVDTTQTFTITAGATTLDETTYGALRRNVTANSWSGNLDEAQIWNRVLTTSEILTLYTNGTVPLTNLVSYHKFNEGSGTTAIDSSGNGNTGTVSGATYSTNVASKPRTLASNRVSVTPLGTSLLFNGTTAVVKCGTANPGNTFTLGAWIKMSALTGGFQTIMAKRDSFSASTMMWQLYLQDSTGEVRFISSAGAAAVTGYIITPGAWTHIAWIRSGTTGPQNLLAINGYIINQATGTLNNGTGTTALITIGANQATPQELFNGRIDEAFICSVALTEAQLQDVIRKRYAAVPSQFALWKFDEGSGSTANDSAGTNTGTITAATYSSDVSFAARTLAS